jgi:hypothetical protein
MKTVINSTYREPKARLCWLTLPELQPSTAPGLDVRVDTQEGRYAPYSGYRALPMATGFLQRTAPEIVESPRIGLTATSA